MRFLLLKSLFLLVACCGISRQVSAQRIPFHHLGVEQGLIQSQATCLAQDGYGHLWIGTLGGLSRWDGQQFVNYSVRDGLPSNTIFSLCKWGRNTLCIATGKGLSVYDGHSFRNYIFASPDNPRGNIVTAVEMAGATVWCIAGGQLYRLVNGKVKSVSAPDSGAVCTSLLYGRDSILWVGTARAGMLYGFRDERWGPRIALGKRAKTIFSLFQDTVGDRQALCGIITEAGIQEYGDGVGLTPSFRAADEAKGSGQLLKGIQADKDNFWFGTTSGATFYTGKKYQHYGRREGLTDNQVNAVLADREGNIWFATDGQGIFRYSGTPFTVLDEGSGMRSNQVSSFAGDDDAVYIGTYEAGLSRFAGDVLIPVAALKNLPVMSMATALGKVWAGTRGHGIYEGSNGSWQLYKPLGNATITALYTSANGNLWMGGGAGFGVLSKDSLHIISRKEGLVTDFLEIGPDSMLISSSNGLQIFSHGVLSPFATSSAADSSSIQCMAKRGIRLCFGTSDNGIIIYNTATGESIPIDKTAGLHSDFIYNLVVDNAGDLWAGTGYGIHRIHFTQNGYSIAFYGEESGISGMESNHNAVLKMADGSLWFGTTGGALHYQPSSPRVRPRPSVILQSVLLYGRSIHDSSYFSGLSPFYGVPEGLRLPYRENNLTFSFMGISLDGSPHTYRYMLAGLDGKWSAWTIVNAVNYSAIPPGKYRFLMQCGAEDGMVQSQAEYMFEIITPFHKTALFRLLILGCCILLGISLQYYANRRRAARLLMMEQLRREEQAIIRERTAEDFHDEVGNKITRINVMASVLKMKLGSPSPEIVRMIESIQDNAGQLYQGTRDILWSLKPSNDSLYEIITRIAHFGQDLFGDTDVRFVFDGIDESWKNLRLPMDASRNLIMIFKEALNNVLKHSAASEVRLVAEVEHGLLRLKLSDNGHGFDADSLKRGHGLDNMQNRAKRLNGQLNVISKKGEGATLILTAKIPPLKG